VGARHPGNQEASRQGRILLTGRTVNSWAPRGFAVLVLQARGATVLLGDSQPSGSVWCGLPNSVRGMQ
jgi:hypothetical protein